MLQHAIRTIGSLVYHHTRKTLKSPPANLPRGSCQISLVSRTHRISHRDDVSTSSRPTSVTQHQYQCLQATAITQDQLGSVTRSPCGELETSRPSERRWHA
jgi:hypothetical protein